MAEMYETLQTQTKQGKYLVYALVAVIVLFLALLAVTIFLAVTNSDESAASTTLCTTAACISLADEILSTINDSVLPCHDFYHYVCDGWIERNSWELIDDPEYSQFAAVENSMKKNFLDEMFWYENQQLTAPEPVQKARTFFETCSKSTTTKDDLQSSKLMREFISIVNFSDTDGFHKALAWLTQREWNSLFTMGVYYKNDVVVQQNIDFWSAYDKQNNSFCNEVNKTFIPLFIELFDVNETDAVDMKDTVCQLADTLHSIGNYPDDYLDAGTLYANYFNSTDLAGFNSIVPDSSELNLTKTMYLTFESSNITDVYYFGRPDTDYLNALSLTLLDLSLQEVQLYIFANVLWYFLDYEATWTQSQDVSRTDFCYDWTLDQFPFVFGYITGNTMYSEEIRGVVDEMVSSVQYDGISYMIENADWLEDDSRETAVDKADKMGVYTGYPSPIFEADGISTYYQHVPAMDSVSWLANVETMKSWHVNETIKSFTNNVFAEILGEWPIIFSQKSAFRYWLTGTNAFYYPGPDVDGANFFVIPVTITQHPFFVADYPSAVNFGGLGTVTGHEMSHGFDPYGFRYAANGTDVGSILSEDDTTEYYDKIDCYIDQYSGLQVRRNDPISNNGTRTQTENVADNAGLKASYLAWQAYKTKNNEASTTLPGVSLSDEKLFFWSWAYLWCDVNRPNRYDNYTNEHSPHYTRVIGSLQNSQEFQDAFQCEQGDLMYKADKCTLW